MHDPVMGDKYTPAVGNDGNFIANVNDDDGAILDSLVSSEAEPPKRDELPIVRIDMRPVPTKPIPAIQSIITRTINAVPKTAYLMASANPWRKRLVVEINVNNSSSALYLASSATAVTNPLTAFSMMYGAYEQFSHEYNGELWAYYDGPATPAITLSVIEFISQETGR